MSPTNSNLQRERWHRLSVLVEKVRQSGVRALTTDEMLEYGRLYRRAVSDLSLARAHGLDARTIDFLNRLVGRAYGQLYRTESRGLPSLPKFFLHEFPRAFRRNVKYVAAAFAVFMVAGTLAFTTTLSDPENAAIFLDPGMLEGLAQRHSRIEGGKPDFIPSEFRPIASSGIMTNNIMVSFIAFSGGVVAGLGTIFILLYNGLHLGVVAAAMSQQSADVSRNFWSFVAPHGVIELPAIFIAAGAGLLLGYALINPGDYTRRDALKLAGREAITLIFGVIAMLVVAGSIEGFLSPAPEIPESVKFTFAIALFTGLCAYLGLAGRTVASNQ